MHIARQRKQPSHHPHTQVTLSGHSPPLLGPSPPLSGPNQRRGQKSVAFSTNRTTSARNTHHIVCLLGPLARLQHGWHRRPRRGRSLLPTGQPPYFWLHRANNLISFSCPLYDNQHHFVFFLVPFARQPTNPLMSFSRPKDRNRSPFRRTDRTAGTSLRAASLFLASSQATLVRQ